MVMAGMGIKLKDICAVMQIDDQTLHKYYRYELETAEVEANVRVAQALYNNAVKHNNVTAQIWWTKSRMGWKDSTDLNLSAADLTIQHLVAARAFSEEWHKQRTIDGEATETRPKEPVDLMAPAVE